MSPGFEVILPPLQLENSRAAVAQDVDWVIHPLEDWYFCAWLLQPNHIKESLTKILSCPKGIRHSMR